MKLVSVSEMVAVEKSAAESGLSFGEMMENAARGLSDYVAASYSRISEKSVLGLVGKGNNGGDTLIALAMLAEQGWKASAYIIEGRSLGDGMSERLLSSGGVVFYQSEDKNFSKLRAAIREHTLILDGVLGTGVKLPLKGAAAHLLGAAKKALSGRIPQGYVVAVDCPSGIDCDSGAVAVESIPADATVCMAAVKQGMLRLPAFEQLGELVLVDIGVPENLKPWKNVRRRVIGEEFVRSHLVERRLDAHKGTFGNALVIAGSINYTGAAVLAGEAAYRIGAGLVTMAIPRSLWSVLAGVFPEAVWLPLPEVAGAIPRAAVPEIWDHAFGAQAVLVGPGLGLAETTGQFLESLLSQREGWRPKGIGLIHGQKEKTQNKELSMPPMVVDADGLKLLSAVDRWPRLLPPSSVLTPHPGEMAVLTGWDKGTIQEKRIDAAETFSRQWGHVVVLKGAFTVIASPDGESAVVPIATPALARAGTGDVLAGMIVGLMAQGMGSFPAACCAAWIHAQAGLLAAKTHANTASVLARDLILNLPQVLGRLD